MRRARRRGGQKLLRRRGRPPQRHRSGRRDVFFRVFFEDLVHIQPRLRDGFFRDAPSGEHAEPGGHVRRSRVAALRPAQRDGFGGGARSALGARPRDVQEDAVALCVSETREERGVAEESQDIRATGPIRAQDFSGRASSARVLRRRDDHATGRARRRARPRRRRRVSRHRARRGFRAPARRRRGEPSGRGAVLRRGFCAGGYRADRFGRRHHGRRDRRAGSRGVQSRARRRRASRDGVLRVRVRV